MGKVPELSEAVRFSIVKLREFGVKVEEIADDLGISAGTVSKIVQKFEETGSVANRTGRGRPRIRQRVQTDWLLGSCLLESAKHLNK